MEKIRAVLRWVVPTGLTVLTLFLVTHQSKGGRVFGRYSIEFFLLIASMGLFAAVCWWIALSETRFSRFANQLNSYPVISIGVLLISLVLIVDLFVETTGMLAMLPFIGALITIRIGRLRPDADDTKPAQYTSLIQKSALLLGSMVAVLIMVELFFRFVLLEHKVPKTEADFARLISSNWPQEIALPKGPDTIHVVGLSDSFGRFGGSQNYHYLLEEELRALGLDVAVINFSVSAYAPIDELALLERFGAGYQPDLVLHGFFVGNDFDTRKHLAVGFGEIPLEPLSGLSALRPRNFLVLQWAQRLITWEVDAIRRSAGETALGSEGTLSTENFLRIERRKMEIFRLRPSPEKHWRATVRILADIQKTVQELGVPYVLIMHPDQVQVNQALQRQLAQEFDLEMSLYDMELPQKFLIELCEAKGVRWIDLLPSMRAQGENSNYYLPNDSHYNQAGNELAAEIIFDYLVSEGLVQAAR